MSALGMPGTGVGGACGIGVGGRSDELVSLSVLLGCEEDIFGRWVVVTMGVGVVISCGGYCLWYSRGDLGGYDGDL